MIKRALISVYDKTGLTGLARALIAADAEISHSSVSRPPVRVDVKLLARSRTTRNRVSA